MKRIFLGILLLLIGTYFFISGVYDFSLSMSDRRQFRAPGEYVLEAKQKGRYHLFYDYRTLYKGRSFSGESTLPDGWLIRMFDEKDGKNLVLKFNTSYTETAGATARRSVAYIDVDPGCYRFRASHEGSVQDIILSVGPGIAQSSLFLFRAFIYAPLALLAGAGFFVWGLLGILHRPGST